MQTDPFHIEVLPKAASEQRESGAAHTSYQEEAAFYALIEQGDTQRLAQTLKHYFSAAVTVGHLSDNPTRQMQYWAVCCITLGIRAAIRGGLEEMVAFHLSDQYIMQVDQLHSSGEIMRYLEQIVLELTELVRKKAHRDCPASIRKCLRYIDAHLHEPVRLAGLSALTGLSPAYLSRLFHQYIGKTTSAYIMEQKLAAAQKLLEEGRGQKEIAYMLGFCSQTYFITCFKEAYGITPYRYAAACRKK